MKLYELCEFNVHDELKYFQFRTELVANDSCDESFATRFSPKLEIF